MDPGPVRKRRHVASREGRGRGLEDLIKAGSGWMYREAQV